MTGGQWGQYTPPAGPAEWLPALDIPAPGRQRRLTVLLRPLLLIPQFIVLFFLHIGAFFATVAGWFAALVLGRLPDPLFRFLTGYLGYQTRVSASAMLLVDRYPPFALTPPDDYPVQIEPRSGHLNRLAVLFRVILFIPAAIVEGLVVSGWWALCVIWWLITLVLGRMPDPLFEASAATLRYQMRFSAYTMMLTSAYPKRFFGDLPETVESRHSATRPLHVGGFGKALLVLFLVAGVVSHISYSGTSWNSDDGTRQTNVAP